MLGTVLFLPRVVICNPQVANAALDAERPLPEAEGTVLIQICWYFFNFTRTLEASQFMEMVMIVFQSHHRAIVYSLFRDCDNDVSFFLLMEVHFLYQLCHMVDVLFPVPAGFF